MVTSKIISPLATLAKLWPFPGHLLVSIGLVLIFYWKRRVTIFFWMPGLNREREREREKDR